MKTLDRYIVRNFLVSTFLWTIVLLVNRTAVDLFVNMDEFAESEASTWETVSFVADYYLHQQLVYITELGGVIIVAGAVFSVARMNHTNELTAMLASGVSLYRVVLPIILCSLLLGGVIVLDHELLIPPLASKIVRDKDALGKVGEQEYQQVRLQADSNRTVWWCERFDTHGEVMNDPLVLFRAEDFSFVASLTLERAEPGEHREVTGWTGVGGRLSSGSDWPRLQTTRRIYTYLSPRSEALADRVGLPVGMSAGHDPVDPTFGMHLRADRLVADPDRPEGGVLIRPEFVFAYRPAPARPEVQAAVVLADEARWIGEGPGLGAWELTGGRVFVPSDLTPRELALRRHGRWLDLLSSRQLAEMLHSKSPAQREMILMARHVRVAGPINNLIMLLLALPFILSRERNIKASASLCVLVVGLYLLTIYGARYVGLPPIWAAWLPILVFGPVAVVMVDSIKT
jgi:lipopolysaccharide export LptBFGC system permease protein LptF